MSGEPHWCDRICWKCLGRVKKGMVRVGDQVFHKGCSTDTVDAPKTPRELEEILRKKNATRRIKKMYDVKYDGTYQFELKKTPEYKAHQQKLDDLYPAYMQAMRVLDSYKSVHEDAACNIMSALRVEIEVDDIDDNYYGGNNVTSLLVPGVDLDFEAITRNVTDQIDRIKNAVREMNSHEFAVINEYEAAKNAKIVPSEEFMKQVDEKVLADATSHVRMYPQTIESVLLDHFRTHC